MSNASFSTQTPSKPPRNRSQLNLLGVMSFASRMGSPSGHGLRNWDANDASDRDITPITSPPQDESLLHRAGLLQPRSLVSPGPSRTPVVPRLPGDIRESTVHLSNMPFASPHRSLESSLVQEPPSPSERAHPIGASVESRDSFIFPTHIDTDISAESASFHHHPATSFAPSSHFTKGSPHFSARTSDLSASTSTLDSTQTVQTANVSQLRTSQSGMANAPSALSILLSRQATSSDSTESPQTPRGPQSQSPPYTPTTERPQFYSPMAILAQSGPSPPRLLDPGDSDTRDHVREPQKSPEPSLTSVPNEETPLLSHARSPVNVFPLAGNGHAADQKPSPVPFCKSLGHLWKRLEPTAFEHLAHQAFKSLPAVILGTLLNILDGVSYGMIIFPASGIFASLGGMGVSMFFVSTLVAQLAYTCGGSNFAGANGSMMIEVVPFFHIMASTIARDVGEENAHEVIATTLVAFALSSLLTGLTFFLLGYLRLGVLIGFFPRHILVGCIGGVGIFLILTGLTVSTRLPSDALDPPTLEILRYFAFNAHALAQWVPPAVLAVLLRVITTRWKHQLLFPIYFLIIPIVFYIVVAAAQLDLTTLRKDGWLFDFAQGTGGLEDKWYGFYTYYDWHAIRWTPLWTTLPTQFALLFFNILHPPLNVPALSVSLDEDIDTNKELVGHGYSNLLSGIFGTVPNYLVYVNTLLFYRVGGGTRIAGFMLALATFLLLIIGTAPIAFLPVMVVSALIFVLGIDLVKEALWDTRHRVSRLEYITIISIMVTMTVWDFVIGVLFGIIVSCFFFVVQNSQRRSIRACYSGDAAMSTVRRPAIHRAYIREVSKQTRILQLQGFLFFGTIVHVEDTIRSMVNEPVWRHHPIRFFVVDLSLVGGVDMSSAEAFVRVQRLLAAKGVVLVFCGVSINSPIGKALASVGILEEPYVELFETLNDAMEWTENAYLRAWFRARKKEVTPVALPGRQQLDIDLHESLTGSPRRQQLRDAGDRTIATELLAAEIASEPFHTLLKAFASYDDIDRDGLTKLVPYFERVCVPEGLVLWEKDDEPNGLYIIESGILRASYKFAEHTPVIEESMVSATLAGELSALSGLPRNAKVMVERQAVLWKLSRESMHRLENDHPHLAQNFVRLVLKAAKVDTDILLAALATR